MSKYRLYSPSILEDAVTAVLQDGISIREAERIYEVPRKTIADKVNGKHCKEAGRPTCLLPTEEEA